MGSKKGEKEEVGERKKKGRKKEKEKTKEDKEKKTREEKKYGRKELREGRREGRRRGDLRNLMSIGLSNWSRSISNFDITFYSTPETIGWSPMEISMVGFS